MRPTRAETELAELSQERAHLVRLCARLTGDCDAAEDLAHESMAEALRHAHQLRDPGRRQQWLRGIARNVCMRWARSRGRALARTAVTGPTSGAEQVTLEERIGDGFDVEV